MLPFPSSALARPPLKLQFAATVYLPGRLALAALFFLLASLRQPGGIPSPREFWLLLAHLVLGQLRRLLLDFLQPVQGSPISGERCVLKEGTPSGSRTRRLDKPRNRR